MQRKRGPWCTKEETVSDEQKRGIQNQFKGGFNLKDFLENEAHAGQQESSGEFSVSNEKALEKLAQYSLVGPYT